MLISEAFAVSAAVCTALSAMLLSELKGRVPLMQLVRWQVCAGFAMTAMASLALGGWRSLHPWQFWLLAASGIVGIAVAGTSYFATIYAVGPRITALLFSLTAPFALLLGYLVLGETIGILQGLGVALVLAGIVLAIGIPGRLFSRGAGAAGSAAASDELPHQEAPRRKLIGGLWLGIGLGAFTALGQAVGALLARPAMASGVEPFTAMAIRTGLSALLLLALAMTPLGWRSRSPARVGTVSLTLVSAFVGLFVGMSLLMAALESGNVGIVATLSSMTPVLILPMVWIRERKRPSLLAWVGASFAIAGTALISLG